jgi:hypothetical protein
MNSRWHAHYKAQIDAAEKEIERLDSVVDRMFGERDDIDDDLTDARGKIDHLLQDNRSLLDDIQRLEMLGMDEREKVTQEQYNLLTASKCANCGGVHLIACPRVKRMRFRPDGQTPGEVEFFPDNEWPKDRITWLEELVVEG